MTASVQFIRGTGAGTRTYESTTRVRDGIKRNQRGRRLPTRRARRAPDVACGKVDPHSPAFVDVGTHCKQFTPLPLRRPPSCFTVSTGLPSAVRTLQS